MSDIRFPNLTASTESVVATVDRERTLSGPSVPTMRVNDQVNVVHLPPSFEYGTPVGGMFQAVDDNQDIKVGDTLRIVYKLRLPFLETWQSKVIVEKLNLDSRFELLHVALNEEIHRLTIEVRVIKPFSPALIIGVAILAVLAGALIWANVLTVERLLTVDTPIGKFNLAPVAILGGLAVVGLFAAAKFRSS